MQIRRILLVDDNPHDLELAVLALGEGAGSEQYEILKANSGCQALEMLHSTVRRGTGYLPDLVLLDLKMPHMDGLAVLDAIRCNKPTGDLPVVILTTSGEQSDIEAAYAHGASAYVIKPLDFQQFCEAMKTIQAFWTHLNCLPRYRNIQTNLTLSSRAR